jgi:hypothetical protein
VRRQELSGADRFIDQVARPIEIDVGRGRVELCDRAPPSPVRVRSHGPRRVKAAETRAPLCDLGYVVTQGQNVSGETTTVGKTWKPFAVRLREELEVLAKLSDELLAVSSIRDDRNINEGSRVVFVVPSFAWAPPTTDLRRLQMILVPRFDRWVERCRLIFTNAPEELRENLDGEIAHIREWLARDNALGGWGSGWDIPSSIEEAKVKQAGRFSAVRELLEVVVPHDAVARAIGLPDTNALIDAPDLELYAAALGVAELDVFVVAPVLAELDNLKAQGKTGDIRAKARHAIARIKEIRDQGSLRDGVEIGSGVRVFGRPHEPKLKGLPGSLDPAVMDDRILGVAFELQREFPAAAVVLVTGDINLQTKAEIAEIPFAEPPEA